MKNMLDDSHIHAGHRARMKSKLVSHGQMIFDTYELLEMLLYYVVPYKDTNPISKKLLATFGGLDNVMRAEPCRLAEVNGIGDRCADFISSVGRLPCILGAEPVFSGVTDFTDYDDVGDFLVDYFKDKTEKSVVALFWTTV